MKNVETRFRKTFLRTSQSVLLEIGISAYLTYDSNGDVILKETTSGEQFALNQLTKTDVENFISTFKILDTDVLYYTKDNYNSNKLVVVMGVVKKVPIVLTKFFINQAYIDKHDVRRVANQIGYNLNNVDLVEI